MSKFRILFLKSLRCAIFGVWVSLTFATQIHAEEITIKCKDQIYKYKKSFWSDPVVSIRTSGQWKQICEEGSLQIHDKGAECRLGYEYVKPIFKTMIQNTKTVNEVKSTLKKEWNYHHKPKPKRPAHLDFGSPVYPNGRNPSDLTLNQYIDFYSPKIGETYQIKTSERTVTTSQTYIIDFYLLEMSRTIADGSHGGKSKKCDIVPN